MCDGGKSVSVNSILLELARKAIESRAKEGDFKEIKLDELEVPDELRAEMRKKRGVFVTLRKKGELRGCIGTLSEDELWLQVQKYAVFSAFNDPRFEPVKPEELNDISVEISIIEDVSDVENISEIKLGEDGIIMELKGRGGVLLPEVAVEHGIRTHEEFLDLLCKKIGVQPGSWKNAKIKKFKTVKVR